MQKYEKDKMSEQLKAFRRILRKPDLEDIAALEDVSVSTVQIYFRGHIANLALAKQLILEAKRIIKIRLESESDSFLD